MADLSENVVVLDSDDARRRRLREVVQTEGRRVLAMTTLTAALDAISREAPQLVLVSLDLAEMPGLAVVDLLVERSRAPLVVLADRPPVSLVVEAIRRGAMDVLVNGDADDRVLEAVELAMLRARTSRRLSQVQQTMQDQYGFRQLLTQSPRMLAVFDQIQQVARTDATALILGETGTGKELVSRAIHDRSRRAEKPFIAVNCGAFTESLLESELFGHERGSFTGAVGRREGLFEMADGGSLFLDELGETSLNVQVNLLRVLEEMRFRRVGGRDLVRVDVRIIAATHVRLEQAVAEKAFRQDLFYRLSVFPIRLPPLRERSEDIPLLMRHFLDDLAEKHGVEAPVLSSDALRMIMEYPWPGNVRQLRAMCERWVITHGGRRLETHDLAADLGGAPKQASGAQRVDVAQPMKDNVQRATDAVERAYLQQLLEMHRGHQGRVAEAAGITRRTLYTKLKEFGIDAGEFLPARGARAADHDAP
jgi:DNA-binding NtrC family response regulator